MNPGPYFWLDVDGHVPGDGGQLCRQLGQLGLEGTGVNIQVGNSGQVPEVSQQGLSGPQAPSESGEVDPQADVGLLGSGKVLEDLISGGQGRLAADVQGYGRGSTPPRERTQQRLSGGQIRFERGRCRRIDG